MKKITITRFESAAKTAGFNIQPGFYGLYVAGKLAAVSSGWCCGCFGYIYTPRKSGRWYGRWVDSWNTGTLASFADYMVKEEEEEEEED